MRKRILLLLSLVFFLTGLSILLSPYPPALIALDPNIHAHLALFTPDQIGALFTALGVFGSGCAFTGHYHLGFSALMFVSVFWALLYVVTWIDTGYWRALFGATQYVLLIGVMGVASKLVESKKDILDLLEKKDHGA